MAKIKICGIKRKEDVDAVNEALPDYVGFVFAKSKRQIDEKKAKSFKERLNPVIKAVGVFVNEDINNIVKICDCQIIDIIQLHGDENEDYLKKLKSCVPNEIIKAVRVKGLDDIKKAREFSCDYLLFDSFHESQYGGSGKSFDWTVISDIDKPFFLAGGISCSNVLQAINLNNPYGIDVSSGVETDGYKDPKKIMDIVAKVKSI